MPKCGLLPFVVIKVKNIFLVLLDDVNHYVWTITFSYKSQVFQTFLKFRRYVLTQFERQIKSFQSDHSHDFDNDPFKLFRVKNGLVFRFSCPNKSSQNGKAKRMARTTKIRPNCDCFSTTVVKTVAKNDICDRF